MLSPDVRSDPRTVAHPLGASFQLGVEQECFDQATAAHLRRPGGHNTGRTMDGEFRQMSRDMAGAVLGRSGIGQAGQMASEHNRVVGRDESTPDTRCGCGIHER
jgi:hypothetical protein